MNPLYILCNRCLAVPVANPGDLCESCIAERTRQQQEAQKKIDRAYGHQLDLAKPLRKGQRNHGREE